MLHPESQDPAVDQAWSSLLEPTVEFKMVKIINPEAITTHVATVRQSTSARAKSQMANMQAMTLTMIHKVMT